jgi:hypothetical protein
VWQVGTATFGLIVAACALTACVSPSARPDPEPGLAATPAASTTSVTAAACAGARPRADPLTCSVPACGAGTRCETDLGTVAPPLTDLVWRPRPQLGATTQSLVRV